VLFGCGKTVGTLTYERVGATQEVPLTLKGGTQIHFAVYAERYSYRGRNQVMLDVELLKGGAVIDVVDRMSCAGWTIRGKSKSGGGCKTTRYNSDCTMTVPAGGADAVRVATRLMNGNEASFTGLQVLVRQ
jgi:hypothetical protein